MCGGGCRIASEGVSGGRVWGMGEEGEGRRTEAMKRPNAPPRAKPITPETAVLPGQDSIIACI